MKKSMVFILWGLLLGLTGCIYIGLLPTELKKHNAKIIEQLPDFPLENYSGNFYNLPDNKDTTIQFSCKDGNLKYFIETKDKLYYMNGEIEKVYTIETKEEIIAEEIRSIYQETYEEIKRLLSLIHNYDGSFSKSSGIRGYDKVGEEILDEIDHYVYDMDWQYSSTAMFVFYAFASNSNLHSFWLRDISNDDGADKPHFQMNLYKENSAIQDIEGAYEAMKQNYEFFEA
ncbi:MAG: hypothetical protein K2N64_06465 [Anaeroplasmataceae bacterium]|nr:hypothetical protein [Anaeroplasmataceae bacterium]